MTRDFNKQRRNDARPPFRDSSSNYNNRDERTPRPARPRLNREVVDRAWESGAPQRHADYRQRDINNTSRQGGQYGNTSRGPRDGQYGNAPRSQQGGQYGNSPRSSYNNYDNRPRVNNQHSESDYGPRRDRNGQGFQDRRPGPYQDGRDTRPSRDTRGNQRDGYRENRYDSPNSSSRFPNQDRREHTGGTRSYGNDGQGVNRRDDYRERDGRNRPGGFQGQNGPRNYASRPYQDRDQRRDERPYDNRSSERRPPRRQDPPAERPQSFGGARAQFEGDYESFNEHEERPRPPRSDERPFRGSPNGRDTRDIRDNRDTRNTRGQYQDRPIERHVTPLPDGRVIKGSRPEQRRNARFWTGVAEETSELVSHVTPIDAVEHGDSEPQPNHEEVAEVSASVDTAIENTIVTTDSALEDATPSPNELTPSTESDNSAEFEATREAIRRRTRAASAVVREKKEKAVRSDSPNIKPSRRGFKWPTQ